MIQLPSEIVALLRTKSQVPLFMLDGGRIWKARQIFSVSWWNEAWSQQIVRKYVVFNPWSHFYNWFVENKFANFTSSNRTWSQILPFVFIRIYTDSDHCPPGRKPLLSIRSPLQEGYFEPVLCSSAYICYSRCQEIQTYVLKKQTEFLIFAAYFGCEVVKLILLRGSFPGLGHFGAEILGGQVDDLTLEVTIQDRLQPQCTRPNL